MNNLGGTYKTGTISISGTAVTGVGTLWTPIAEIGDWILCNGQVGMILTVNGDTLLTLETTWQGTPPSGATYVLIKMSWLRYEPALMQAKLRELLAELEGAGNFIFTDVDPPDPAIGQDGDWALRTSVSPWQLWFKSGGVWVEQASPAGIEWRGTWSAATPYQPSDAVSRNGSSYVSKTSNTNQAPETNADDWDLMAAQGATGPTGPEGVVWRGTWNSATAYAIDDAVSDTGASYIAIAANTNSQPPSANWNLLAQGGSTIIAPDSVTPTMLDAGTAAKQGEFRVRLASAAFDALAYNGLQINGSMEVSQQYGVAVEMQPPGYITDGWTSGFVSTGTQKAAVLASSAVFPGITHYLNSYPSVAGPGTPAAADIAHIVQRIEGYRIGRLQWGGANAQPITIAFWTKHVRTGTYSVSVRNSASNRSYVTTYTQNVSDTAEFKTVTIPGDITGTWTVDNTAGITLGFCMSCGATQTTAPNVWTAGNFVAATGQVNATSSLSDRFRVTGVVVLPGTQAPTAAQSPLIMRPYDQELVMCQRYYEKQTGPGTFGSGHCVSATGAYIAFKYVQKRSTPALTAVYTGMGINFPGASGTTVTSGSAIDIGVFGCTYAVSGASGLTVGTGTELFGNSSSSISIDARL